MKKRTKTVEVIATRDDSGRLSLWATGGTLPSLYKSAGTNLYYWDFGTCIAYRGRAVEMLGGTYCGIRKGGMKRLRVTTTVEEVAA